MTKRERFSLNYKTFNSFQILENVISLRVAKNSDWLGSSIFSCVISNFAYNAKQQFGMKRNEFRSRCNYKFIWHSCGKIVWKTRPHLFSPSMRAIWVGAHIVQSHFFFGSTSLGLEEYRFTMSAFRTSMVFSSW